MVNVVGLEARERDKILAFDIETYEWEFTPEFSEHMSGGKMGNRVDKAKIEEKRKLNRDKFALSPLTGRIILAGFHDGESYHMFDDADEKELILKALSFLSDRHYEGARLITKGGKRFDLPFLATRATILGIEPQIAFQWNLLLKKYDTFYHIDLEDIFEGKLSELGYLMGLTNSFINRGGEIGEMYETGKKDEIVAKNEEDLRLTLAIYRNMKWMHI